MFDHPQRPEHEQARFFDDVHTLSRRAIEATGVVTRVLRIAETTVRLEFAGPTLAQRLLPALAHLTLPDDTPADAVFRIWDTVSTGVEMVPPPVDRALLTDRGDIRGFQSHRYRIAFRYADYSVNVFDRQQRVGVFWTHDGTRLPYWTGCSPLRSLFHWWTELNGYQLVHAAAIGDGEQAVLITGPGGVGKSTTALSALVRGMKYIGDDYVIVRLDPEPRVYSLYATAKLNHEQVPWFPMLGDHITNSESDDEKATLYLWPALAQQIVPSLPLKAVVTPRVHDVETTDFVGCHDYRLVHAASFTTMSQLPCAGDGSRALIAGVIDALPGLQLRIGRDLDEVTAGVRRLLRTPDDELASVGAAPPRKGTQPLVSVVVPVFNGAPFIAGALASIRGVGYPNIEVIVVDDGSTDDLDAALQDVEGPLRVLKQDNKGPSAARNTGIRHASGDFVAFLDVDDSWAPGFIDMALEVFRDEPELQLVRGHAQVLVRDDDSGHYYHLGNAVDAYPFYIGLGLYRKTAFERVGLFDESMRVAEDTDWQRHAEEIGLPMRRLEATTLYVRRHGGNMTAGLTAKELNPAKLIKRSIERRRARKRLAEKSAQ